MPALPSPLGEVRFRHYAGESDFPGLVGAYNASHFADGVSGVDTLEEFANRYRHLTNCDLDTDFVVVEAADGEIAGYARATWWVEEATNDRLLFWILHLVPAARVAGVQATLIEWLEGRLSEISREHPHAGKEMFATALNQGQVEREAGLAAAGYQRAETAAEMIRPLSEPIPDLPFPPGVAVRPVTWDDARQIWEADNRAFRDHVGYSPQTETDYAAWRASALSNPELWKVAFAGDVIAGQVLNYVNEAENTALGRNWGYTENISVQREWRRRGVARALIAESMRMWRDLGYEHAALGVHTTNPNGAFPLYQGLGYQVIRLEWAMRKNTRE